MERTYAEYAARQAMELLAIDSPTGFTARAADWVQRAFEELGYTARHTAKGGVLVDLGGRGEGLLLEAHADTLGGMVAEVKNSGRLRLTPLGGMRAENGEAENVRVYTRGGRVLEGTFQLCNASVHVNGQYGDTKRTFDSCEVVLDEDVKSAEETRTLGVEVGDVVCFEPRTRLTASGYIKSRFLDDKLSVGILLGLAALALLAAAPRLQKRYGPQWLCRLWVTLAVLLLMPLHALVPQAPAAVSVDTTPLYSRTALSQEVTERPADGVPYMAAPTGYIVPRAELQTGHRTVLERLAVGATRLNLLALAWNLGVLAVALYQFGGYAVWRIRVRRTAQPVDPGWRSALPQVACPRMVATPLVRSPMVAGTLHPVLLTPTGTAPKGADYMLAHELTHIKRHDVAKKLLFTLACAVHWYNPAVWLLAARAGRDIEEACDAETLCGRDADCRAAYADALLTAVRQNRGPALTSGFALNKRQFKQRLAALWDTAPKHRGRALLAVLALTACCAGWLVACKPADAAPQDEQEPAATAAPAPSETAKPIVTPEPPPVSMEAGAAAVRRGADFLWSEYLTDGNGYYYHSGACGLVEPEDYDTEYISALLETRRDDGTTWRDYLNDGRGALVKATFEAELTPEAWYLGKQYGEGRFHVYLIAPFDESQPCEVISGWQSADDPNQSAHFEILPMARELDLTNNQYRMLLHQCDALAQAGARDFGNPGDWPQDELETYLYYRNRYFYGGADALLMLNVDFTPANDWNQQLLYLTYDEVNALDFSAPKTAALPGYTPPESLESDDPGVWTFTREGLYITAEWPGVERYTFYVHNGNASLKFDARTICVQGRSLS